MPQSQSTLKIGTRGSKLALAQAGMVRTRLAEIDVRSEIVVVKTSGDRIQDRCLADAGGKGLFTKELEEALRAKTVDLAVHSMKDVPVEMAEDFRLCAVLPREDPRDAFISNVAQSLEELPKGARIGTSSVRRKAQIARARPDLEILLLRGNVDTRLAKLDAGQYDAILLAYAGLKRLRLEARVTALLSPQDWLPALSQGAVGIEVRSADEAVSSLVAKLMDTHTFVEISCERAFQLALDGSCRTPIAGLATYSGSELVFHGEVLAPDGSDFVETRIEARLNASTAAAEAHRLGFEAGAELKPRAARWLAL